MASGASLRNKAIGILRKFQATHKVVKLRQTVTTGSEVSQRLGIAGVVSTIDTIVDPQPAVSVIEQQLLRVSGGLFQFGDLQMVFAGTVTEETLLNSSVLYGDTLMKIISMTPASMSGIVVAWTLHVRPVELL